MAATQRTTAAAEHADRSWWRWTHRRRAWPRRAAAELAAARSGVEGLFVEDINLLHLCGLPFGREVGSYTASVRQLNDRAMERNLRALAIVIREAMEREAAQLPVRWTFQVRRGAVVAELLAASQSAAMLSLGRAGRRRRQTLGSVAESVVRQCSRPVLILGEEGGLTRPLSVLYTGSEAADRALRLAIDLEVRNPGGLRVWVWDDPAAGPPAERLQAHANARLAEVGLRRRRRDRRTRAARPADKRNKGTLILPGEHSALLSRSARRS